MWTRYAPPRQPRAEEINTRQGLVQGDVDSGGLDGLIVVLDGPEDQAQVRVDQTAQTEKGHQHEQDQGILFHPAVGETGHAEDPVGPAQNVQGLDDPHGQQGIHEGDDGKIDPPQRQAGQDGQGAEGCPTDGGQGNGKERDRPSLVFNKAAI